MKKDYKKILFSLLFLAVFINFPKISEAATSVTSSNITWTFADNETCGEYANGDPWCLGPVTITNISPLSTFNPETQRIQHGSMLNPGASNGYDNTMNNKAYSETLNAGRPNGADLSASNPLLLQGGNSLVSTKTNDIGNTRPQIVDAAVLTIVTNIPTAGSFRPPYAGTDKISYWNVSDIRWDKLPALPSSSVSSLPDLRTLESKISKVWLDQGGGVWTGREFHPSNNMPDYGRDMSIVLGDVALALLLNYPQTDLEQLMITFLQLGIDWYGVTENAPNITTTTTQGGLWMGGGGHGIGRKWPMLFTGLMFDDTNILKFADGEKYPIFQEEQQHFYVSQRDVDLVRYTADGRLREPYTSDMIGMAEWGESHWLAPQRDGSNWNAPYREIVSKSIPGHALAATIMGAQETWNWDSFFEYQDRWWQHQESVGQTGSYSAFVNSMWAVYRDDYDDVVVPPLPGTTPTCTSFTYSEWSTCTNDTQTRTVTSSSPTDCTGGTPVLTQSCITVVVPPTYTLTTSRAGTGSGTITSSGISCGTDCSETFLEGTSVTLTATPATNSTFTGWSGACSGTQTTCTVSVQSALNVLTTFTLIETTIETIDTTAPTVTNMVLTQTGNSGLTLTWDTSEPATTRLEYGTTVALGISTLEDTTLTRTHSVTLNKLVRGETYYVQARSRDAAGNIALSPIKSITISVKPSKVTTLKATAGSVNLSWKLPKVRNFTSITVYRNGTHIATLPAVATTYRDTAVDPSTTYSYKVYTVDSDLTASDPASVTFKTRSGIPRNEAKTTVAPEVSTTVPASSLGGGVITTSGTPTTEVSSAPTIPRYTFTASLKPGSTHSDVQALQQFLNTHGYAVAQSGPGSVGNETTYYGPATKAALIKFQQANNIGDTTSYGLVGPQTRAKLNALQVSTTPTTTLPDLTGIRLTDAQRVVLERVLGISR